ncbi:hypothetical protein WG947_01165 [Pontibacter sp. H259]|uniref:hypothetical protein n=1 Tax=Pontibacter sp. H259 TaxID=3133421 RepID=UPI0030BD1D21
MHFNLADFVASIPEGITKQELGTLVYEEIRSAENLKVGYLDQAQENPDFYVNISRQIDYYINNLKLLHNKLAPTPVAPDQELYASEQADLEQIAALVERINESERNRHKSN